MKKNSDLYRLFRAARGMVWDGHGHCGRKEKYACFAIDRLSDRFPVDLILDAERIIRSQLGTHDTLASWLKSCGVADDEMTLERMQRHRLQWLDRLADQYRYVNRNDPGLAVAGLRAALPYLRSDLDISYGDPRGAVKTDYICWAIGFACKSGDCGPLEASRALELITDRLGGAASIELWLMAQGVPRSELTRDRLQLHRHQWVSQLIRELANL